MSKHKLDYLPGHRMNRGLGRTALCEECNNKTGQAYGPAYLEWVIQAKQYVDKAPRDNQILLSFYIQPLRVIKQIATMALAASDFAPGFRSDLRRFVLLPFEQHVPGDYRFFVYLNPERNDPNHPSHRMTGMAAMMDMVKGGQTLVMAEIAFRRHDEQRFADLTQCLVCGFKMLGDWEHYQIPRITGEDKGDRRPPSIPSARWTSSLGRFFVDDLGRF